ncbi:MAG TPA: Rrf2 family transcriptional regulator [Crocinitomicaceae bacterium]|jgi:Rrf2 family transcriptional regulator, iron-sulfur cluster assembly transcription factor|nr:Rrf2 family transcriptional regulator [Crocinitomicaceae bacterium]
MFSKTCEYGIRSAIYVAVQSLEDENRRIKLPEIIEHVDTPVAFTAKILGVLNKAKIISSKTGPTGGFYVGLDQMKKSKLIQIVDALDGDRVYNGCAMGLDSCNHENPCPMHEKFISVREELKVVLETTSLYDMAVSTKSGKTFLSSLNIK